MKSVEVIEERSKCKAGGREADPLFFLASSSVAECSLCSLSGSGSWFDDCSFDAKSVRFAGHGKL